MPRQHILPCASCHSFESVDVEIVKSDLFLESLVSDGKGLGERKVAHSPSI